MSTTTVAIAGLTGKFARQLAGHLLSKPNVHVNGICRSPNKLPANLANDSRVSIFQASSDDVPALRKGLKGADVAVCCYLGDDKLMQEGQKTLIDACIAEGVPRYIAGDWSLDFRGLEYGQHPSKDPMKHVADYLDEKKSKIEGVHVLNGVFMEVFWSFSGHFDPTQEKFKIWGTGNEKLDMTTYNDAAAYTAEVAVDSKANGWIEVAGDTTSVREAAAAYKDVYGVDPKTENVGSLDDLHKVMVDAQKAEPNNIWAWMQPTYNYYMLNQSTKLKGINNERFPKVKPTNVRAFLQKHKKEDLKKVAMEL